MTVASQSHRTRPTRFGLHTALPRGADFTEFARTVEESGFDVLTIPDHLAPTLAPFSGAAAACAATTHLRTGTLVLNNDLRHPVDTARETVSVAALSGGRFELGLGAGHMKAEYDAAGLKFDDGATRVDRLIESVDVIRPLLAGEPVDVDGLHYCVRADAGALVTSPGVDVPLLIGGNGTRVLQLAGRVADIAGLAGFSHNHDATEVRLTHFDPTGLLDRIAVVADAAGERFENIELNGLLQFVVHTDDPAAAAAEAAAALKASPELLLQSPFALFGTYEQMAEALADRQRRFGISYWTVFDEWPGRESALPHVAEVIKLLR
ncbi:MULTISPECIES: TIGR03621 family F420-dependent LLM class oxidoreductase [Mycolicibacterium]|uniref:Oxidoreductase n=1 Tax=Mycolicibacterium senegalense TaxID=1796 RepID=A0A378T5T6_9MYCO|nr:MULTISPECIES: TIGR03621 family F420-dependent LLM class oxidoreductase [Mycolicibacterium]MCV7336040.1 TIGR03621 family F420-dependent LLM class oxidoreductase [Mycolicibacterium senegalense]MDR7291091.1 putative F420-dependent oxidoreductase [Mycolicibacterium senegalense]QZA22613.1 TIGR03621 family F420-dependent LLM class oxidoreductase [Mycolicibacterium senegalense]CDP83492.1 oxidoreductase [Mycolicibacterium farcinogenes]STZ55255.1 oxidoreductase [Mycolicibacterium senegalense]